MSEHDKPQPHRWRPGTSGNPRGRKPGPMTLARAVREAWPPERLVELATKLADDPDPSIRLRALEWLSDRAHGRAPVTIEATLTTGLTLEADQLLAQLSTDTLRELHEASERLALEAAEPAVIDVTAIDVRENAPGLPEASASKAEPSEPPEPTSERVASTPARFAESTTDELPGHDSVNHSRNDSRNDPRAFADYSATDAVTPGTRRHKDPSHDV